ncbi:MAG: hypothetical protein NZM11_12780, partial [Anaerolineales bacterium]|nr:hypothetical protein [Anaerolineales bacterium]
MTEQPRSVALFHSENWDNAAVWLRVRAPAAVLGWRVYEGNLLQDGRLIQFWPDVVERADYVIIQRQFPRFTEAFDVVLRQARAARKPVIYELDDLLLELPRDHPDWRYHIRSCVSILRAVMEADAVVVSTQPLAAYLQSFNPAVYVWPNCWDEALWPLRAPEPAPDRPL